MRLTLVVVLCLLNTGCALWRKDQAEPVDNQGPRKEKVEPQLKPSEVLKPKSLKLASPVSDRFYMRGTYFTATTESVLRLDPTVIAVPGSTLSGEDDLGLDDKIDQARMEFEFRFGERNHLRFDYFKIARFAEQPLPRTILFGNVLFGEGVNFRTNLDWRVLTLTYTYSFFKSDRWEAGLGLGAHIIEGHMSGGAPGTLTKQKVEAAGIFPTIAVNGAYRISKRWAVTLRGQQYSATPDDFNGEMSDYHGDIQYRWRKNFAVGLGYTQLESNLEVEGAAGGLFNISTAGPELFFRASF